MSGTSREPTLGESRFLASMWTCSRLLGTASHHNRGNQGDSYDQLPQAGQALEHIHQRRFIFHGRPPSQRVRNLSQSLHEYTSVSTIETTASCRGTCGAYNERMRKRLFMLSILLLLVGLAVGTRYGDVVLYTADWVFAASTLVVFAAWCFWWLPDHRLVALSTDWSSLLLVAAVIVLTLLSPYAYGAQVEAAKLGSALLLAVMVLNLVQERGDLQFFLNGILFLGMGMAAVSFAYYMAAMSPLFYFTPLWASNLQYHFVVNGQLWGLWQYHNSFAGFLVLCILLSVGMATGDKRRDWRLLYDACAGFLLMVLYLTTSRGAFLTGIIGLIVLVLLAPRGWRGRVLLRVLIVGAAAAGFTVLNRVTWATAVLNADKGAALGTFVTGGADQSNDTRVHLIVLALRLFREHVWAGTGLGTFPHVWTAFEWVPDVSRRIDPHSFFFRFLAETGLLGTVPLFTWIVRRGLHGLDRVFGSREDMAVTGLWAGTLAYFLHMCMDVDYVYAVAPAILFLCLALLSTRTVTYDLVSRDDRHTMVHYRRIPCLIAGGLALLLALVPIQRGVASLYALRLGGLDTATKAEHLTDTIVRDPALDGHQRKQEGEPARDQAGDAPIVDHRVAVIAADQVIRHGAGRQEGEAEEEDGRRHGVDVVDVHAHVEEVGKGARPQAGDRHVLARTEHAVKAMQAAPHDPGEQRHGPQQAGLGQETEEERVWVDAAGHIRHPLERRPHVRKGPQSRACPDVFAEQAQRQHDQVDARVVGLVGATSDKGAQRCSLVCVEHRRGPGHPVEHGEPCRRSTDAEHAQENAPPPATRSQQNKRTQADDTRQECPPRCGEVQHHEQEARARIIQEAPVATLVTRRHADTQQNAQDEEAGKGVVILPQTPQLTVHDEVVLQVARPQGCEVEQG